MTGGLGFRAGELAAALLGAAVSTNEFAPTFLSLRPLAFANRASASAPSMRPRMDGAGRPKSERSGIEMLIPACLPMANAAVPTVPAGTSIGLGAAWPGVARVRSAASDAQAYSVLIARPFLPASSLDPIVRRRRRAAAPVNSDRA